MPISIRYPFAGTYIVSQTPTGRTSHTDDYSFGVYNPKPLVNYWTAAYDFAMSVGTRVLAVAPGIVVGFRENVVEGGSGPSHNAGNFVTIRHNPGTANEFYATYQHLRTNGVLVESGTVVAGQLIGYSGNTGLTEGPHLHLGFGTTSFVHQSGDVLALATDAQDNLINFNGARPSLNASVIGGPEVFVTTQPDLVIQNAHIDDVTVNIGQSINVDWEVRNSGTGAAAVSNGGVYLSRDAVWNSADIKVGNDATIALSASSTDTGEHVKFVVPTSVSAGTWYVLVVGDDGKQVTESSESNNVWSQKITVSNSTSRPDLVIQNAHINDTTVKPGQTVKVSWDVLNIGTAEAAGTDTFIFLSRDMTLTSSDRYLDHETLSTMSVNERDAEYQSFTMPTDLARGHYYLAVVADAGLAAAETNEANNIAWIPYDIV